MKFVLLLLALLLPLLASISNLPGQTLALQMVQQPRRLFRKIGPLYDALKLLIAEQSLSAARQWNSTSHQFVEHFHLVDTLLDEMNAYQQQINERVQLIFHQQYTDEFRKCFKQYERQVAHFNRELLNQYSECHASLYTILEQFKQSIAELASHMSTAAAQVAALAQLCKIAELKEPVLEEVNQQGIVLCVAARIGRINHRMASAAEVAIEIMLDLSLEELETRPCRKYKQLKTEFDGVYTDIQVCEKDPIK